MEFGSTNKRGIFRHAVFTDYGILYLCIAADNETPIQVSIPTHQIDIPKLCHFLCSFYGVFLLAKQLC
ncbi:hypothetical protein NC651_001106 [Populus alba x Populus x berolinensis]|nr:hypothetical protein NC651_001106 [Populus alba x Populus x berolinensis]